MTGGAWFSPIDQADINAQVPKLLDVASVPATICNWGGDDAVSTEEYVTFLASLVGESPRFVYTDQGIPGRAFDNTRRIQLIGNCDVTWQDGFRKLAAAALPRPRSSRLISVLERGSLAGARSPLMGEEFRETGAGAKRRHRRDRQFGDARLVRVPTTTRRVGSGARGDCDARCRRHRGDARRGRVGRDPRRPRATECSPPKPAPAGWRCTYILRTRLPTIDDG